VHSFRVGRVFGIELRIDWSLVVIFALLTWEIAVVVLPDLAASYAAAEYWAAAILATALFLATLATHELSHSLVARRRGIAVHNITLWMLGGIATLEGNAKTPGDDLAIALAGPAASVTIGLTGIVIGIACAAVSAPSIVVASILWVALINLVLAVFNLAPAAPLDGGRVLRAWLWKRSGDRPAATIKAAHAGRVFAWLLIVGGFAEFAFGSPGGLWLMVLGWFVFTAARAEERQEALERALNGVRVRDVMTSNPTTAPDSVSVARLIDEYVLRSPGSAFPLVGADGRVTGLAEMSRCKLVPPEQRAEVLARDIAEPIARIATAAPDDMLIGALARTSSAPRRLLVFDGDDLVGIVTPTDIMRNIRRAPLRAAHQKRDAA
jgi:Zn-dependent protease